MNSYRKKQIIAWAAPILSGLGVYQIFAPRYAGMGHILTFHRIVSQRSGHRIHNHLSLEISPEQLESTIQFYKKKQYQFISLDELHEILTTKKKVKRFVVFTFDDGYLDNYQVAYPILKKYSIPFTIYITTNFPDHQAILWWYLLEDLLKAKNQIYFEWDHKIHRYDCSTLTLKEIAFDQVRALINQSFDNETHLELLSLLFDKNEKALRRYSDGFVMNWNQIKLLSEDTLCTIGAHTINHYPLRQLTEEQVKFEVEQSRTIIEKNIGKAVDHFAYPFGKSSEASFREFDLVAELGFKTATTTRSGNIFEQHESHLTCLPRISVNGVTTHNVLKLQSSGMLPFLIHKGKRVITN